MAKIWTLCVFIFLSLTVAQCQLIHKDDYPDEWIDPFDMANFEYSRQKEVEKPGESIRIKKKENLANVERKEDVATPSQGCKSAMLKRYVSVLTKHIEAAGKPDALQQYEMSLKIDGNTWNTLQKFGDNCQRNAIEVVEILEKMVADIRVHEEFEVQVKRTFEDITRLHFEEFLKLAFAAFIFICILSLEIVSRVSWMSQLKRLFVLGILVSVVMTYYHEVKVAEAEFKAKSNHLPKECMRDLDEISYFSTIRMVYNDWFSTKSVTEHCKEYHETFLIHPKLKVTPTKVLAVTFTRFAVEPLEHMGVAFSKGFKKVFAGLPVTLWIPAFLLVIILILGFMLIVAVMFGYHFNINLPFWAGLQIAPPPQVIQNHPEMEHLRIENTRLHDRMEDLQRNPPQQALPPVPSYHEDSRRRYDRPPSDPPVYGTRGDCGNLPYPDLGPDPTASGDAFRNCAKYYQQSSRLRRRHTASDMTVDSTLPYPEEPHPVRRSTSDPPEMRDGIGFEPLVRGLTEAQMDEIHESPARQDQRPSDQAAHKGSPEHKNGDKQTNLSKRSSLKPEFMKTKKVNNCDLNLDNDNSEMDAEDVGRADGTKSKDDDWVEIASTKEQSGTVDYESSEPTLSHYTREAEAGFTLD